MENSWHTYPKVWAIGHPNLAQLFFDEVIVEEKIDGSQFSFGMFDGELKVKSRGQMLQPDAPEKMFVRAIETAVALAPELKEGWSYRAEYLQKPKHNTLVYGRIPEKYLILFDINDGFESYLSYEQKKAEADRLGLECVPLLCKGKIDSAEQFKELLDSDSILGGTKVEGVVCKNYTRFGRDGKVLLGKYVSEAFKEKHVKDWKVRNPGGKDMIQITIESLRTEARWHKAIQHMKEAGELELSPRDIGNLLKELHKDLEAECGDEIKEKLYKWAIPKIKRGVCAGFPEWYKEFLLKSQFEEAGV